MNGGTSITLEERLFGLIWNHQKDPSMPLWWCLDDPLKETFRKTLTAELGRNDPTVRHPLGRGT